MSGGRFAWGNNSMDGELRPGSDLNYFTECLFFQNSQVRPLRPFIFIIFIIFLLF